MKIQDINEKWLLIAPGRRNGHLSVRIDSKSFPDLFIGLNNENNRSLILKLPKDYSPDFQSSVKQNLSLNLYSETGWVVLTLLDEQYFDLFDDLIFSIYNKIQSMSSAQLYVTEFLKTFYKWSEFFQESRVQSLSDEIIRGLFGELIVLSELLLKSASGEINDVLDSWKGPYDTNHDFVNESISAEVKTRLNSVSNIKISSEYQLQPDTGKALELLVVTLISDTVNGTSLLDLVHSIRDYVVSKLGDYTIILRGLSQKGLSIITLAEYEHLKFIPVMLVSYDCCHPDFPRLVRSNIAPAVSSVSYKLNVEEIKPFTLSEKLFNGNQ